MTLVAAIGRRVAAASRAPREPRGLVNPLTVAGGAVVLVLVLAGILAPLLTGHSPLTQTADSLLRPGGAHLLGTDEFGRDIFSRVLYGIRLDVQVISIGVPIGALLGVALGLLASLSRFTDTVMQRVFDVLLSFTALIAGVTVAAIVTPGKSAVIITIVVLNIPQYGRLIRGLLLSQGQRDYAVAAAVGGASPVRVLVRHVLPNCLDPLIVQTALSLSTAVFIEGAMSYVGVGVVPPAPSLGSVLQGSTPFLSENAAYALGPMVAVTLLVLGFQMIADGLTKGLLKR
jgi:peptide/nickel transport system permease protein